MEALTRLVTESLVRHGFDRPPDYRRLQWSRWFRCTSHHSLLSVPSQPGVFAIAEEITDLGTAQNQKQEKDHVGTAASAVQRSETSAAFSLPEAGSQKPEPARRRMLAVTQFFEDDDMAFVLDRMLSRENPMRARLASGRYFVRFVVVEDAFQRRSICAALNQWMTNSAEKATGIGSHFATSLELTPATEFIPEPDPNQADLFENKPSAQTASAETVHVGADALVRRAAPAATLSAASIPSPTAPHLDSGAASNLHCPNPLPSGF